MAYDLSSKAQDVWNTNNITNKKVILLEMVDLFVFKDKQLKFRNVIQMNCSSRKLDKLAADLMLADTDKVVKL